MSAKLNTAFTTAKPEKAKKGAVYTKEELESRKQKMRWSISDDGTLSIWIEGGAHYEIVSDSPMHRALATWVKNHPAYLQLLHYVPTPPVGNIWSNPDSAPDKKPRHYSVG